MLFSRLRKVVLYVSKNSFVSFRTYIISLTFRIFPVDSSNSIPNLTSFLSYSFFKFSVSNVVTLSLIY